MQSAQDRLADRPIILQTVTPPHRALELASLPLGVSYLTACDPLLNSRSHRLYYPTGSPNIVYPESAGISASFISQQTLLPWSAVVNSRSEEYNDLSQRSTNGKVYLVGIPPNRFHDRVLSNSELFAPIQSQNDP